MRWMRHGGRAGYRNGEFSWRASMARLGFVGLGVMGSRVVKRLLDAGHAVTGYNRTSSKARWLVEAGMNLAATPRAVAESSDVTFAMVTNSAALEAVAEGPTACSPAWAPASCSRHEHRQPRDQPALADACGEGAAMVDAPVSGSVVTLRGGQAVADGRRRPRRVREGQAASPRHRAEGRRTSAAMASRCR